MQDEASDKFLRVANQTIRSIYATDSVVRGAELSLNLRYDWTIIQRISCGENEISKWRRVVKISADDRWYKVKNHKPIRSKLWAQKQSKHEVISGAKCWLRRAERKGRSFLQRSLVLSAHEFVLMTKFESSSLIGCFKSTCGAVERAMSWNSMETFSVSPWRDRSNVNRSIQRQSSATPCTHS